MPLTTRNPTSNTTPDPTLGGGAVTGNINTGHASTVTAKVGAGSSNKSCLWQGFAAAPGGTIVSVTIKVDWIQDGILSDGGVATSNQFTIEYSLNGGGSWNTLRDVSDIQSSSSGTSQAGLSVSQDLTQVRVRDNMIASASPGESSSVTTTVSNIRIEVVTIDDVVVSGGM